MEENNTDSIKLKMLKTFNSEIKSIYNEFSHGNLTSSQAKFHIKKFFESWLYCRFDVKNQGNESNSIISLNSDSYLNIKYPSWFKNKVGLGCVIQSKDNLKLKFKCVNDGSLIVYLRGVDHRNYSGKRVPILVNFTMFSKDNDMIFKENQLIWHDKPFKYNNVPCCDGEEISFNVSFDTIYDYFPKLIFFKKEFGHNTIDLTQIYNLFEEYVELEKNNLSNDYSSSRLYDGLYDLSEKNYYLSKELSQYKEETNKILDSYNMLFNSIFKFHYLEPKQLVKYSRELNNQLLDFIDNVCKKYDLQWWLNFGTLLGAIRHGDYIPWDDDCDIGMMRTDYEKFYNVVHDEIKLHNLDEYMVVNFNKRSNNGKFLLSFMKIEYFVGNRLFGFIDVSPYDFINNTFEGMGDSFIKEHRKFISDMKSGVSRDVALNHYLELFNVSQDKTAKIIRGVESTRFYLLDYETIFPIKEINFGNRYYSCPNDEKKVIMQIYGSNYMKIPKIIKHHGFYDALSRYGDVYQVFEEHIDILKRVNSKLKSEINI